MDPRPLRITRSITQGVRIRVIEEIVVASLLLQHVRCVSILIVFNSGSQGGVCVMARTLLLFLFAAAIVDVTRGQGMLYTLAFQTFRYYSFLQYIDVQCYAFRLPFQFVVVFSATLNPCVLMMRQRTGKFKYMCIATH